MNLIGKLFLCVSICAGIMECSTYGKIKKNRKFTSQQISSLSHSSKCPQCDYKTDNRGNLQRHLRERHDIYPFVCSRDDCAQEFASLTELRAHIKKGHEVSRKDIAQYTMIDSRKPNIKALKCPECHMLFSTKWRGNFHRHLRRWHNQQPFFCMNQDCLQGFSNEHDLQEHKKNCSPLLVLQERSIGQASAAAASASAADLPHIPNLDTKPIDVSVFEVDEPENVYPLRISPYDQLNIATDEELGIDH